MGDRDVRDVERLDAFDVGAGCADSKRSVSGGDILGKLGRQQKGQAHVDGRQMGEPQNSPCLTAVISTCHWASIAGHGVCGRIKLAR